MTAAPASQNQFDGDVAEMYGKFFNQVKPSWEAMLAAVDRVNAGGFGRPKSQRPDSHMQRVLDLASGPGQPALLIADKYRATRVESTDVSPDMVAQARASAAAAGVADRVTCSVRDMNDLSAYEAESMDLVTVSFGLMFTRWELKIWAPDAIHHISPVCLKVSHLRACRCTCHSVCISSVRVHTRASESLCSCTWTMTGETFLHTATCRVLCSRCTESSSPTASWQRPSG